MDKQLLRKKGVIARVRPCFDDVMLSAIALSAEDHGLSRWSGQPKDYTIGTHVVSLPSTSLDQ